ncbi:unnamed protein product [Allacma fusca]|uniref:Uncharacterized protein n=1 Tax=Allacma fusca TaxID=39272 RepID=A0A8J2JIT3_9HEXA|nr:unnamed protein product [Allacma fusca]
MDILFQRRPFLYGYSVLDRTHNFFRGSKDLPIITEGFPLGGSPALYSSTSGSKYSLTLLQPFKFSQEFPQRIEIMLEWPRGVDTNEYLKDMIWLNPFHSIDKPRPFTHVPYVYKILYTHETVVVLASVRLQH